ncbi:MAG: hypothetical protein ACK55O_09740 [Phycisphaerales bacterium]|nr:hypothetical protein [Phycisphaeraceae bacterium]
MRWLWSRRWNLARLCIAAVLVLTLLGDTSQRMAVMLMASLPTHDHAAEARELLGRARYADALLTVEAGIEFAAAELAGETATSAPDRSAAAKTDPMRRLEELRAIRQQIERERSGVLRRASDFARGAITGGSNPANASLEALAGAVITDLFIVGDIRDLIVQGGKAIIDGPAAADPVIVALSTVGVVTTLAPEVDWAPSLLKLARRSGTMSRELGQAILAAGRAGDARAVARIAEEAGGMARAIGPGPAMRTLSLAQSVEDLSLLRSFIGRGGARAAVALRHAGEPGMDLLRTAARGGPEQLRAVEAGMLTSARAGPRGLSLLPRLAPTLARPHLLVGLGKALYKGTGWNALQRAIEALRPWHAWLLPLAMGWLALECVRLVSARRIDRVEAGKSVDALGPSVT